MKVVVIASIASFAAAFAAASWIYTADSGVEAPSRSAEVNTSFDAALPVEDRIAAFSHLYGLDRRLLLIG